VFLGIGASPSKLQGKLGGICAKDPYRLINTAITTALISCYASKLNTEMGSPARPPIIVEKLTVTLDAQQLTEQYSPIFPESFLCHF
jgi:hypothetical protein